MQIWGTARRRFRVAVERRARAAPLSRFGRDSKLSFILRFFQARFLRSRHFFVNRGLSKRYESCVVEDGMGGFCLDSSNFLLKHFFHHSQIFYSWNSSVDFWISLDYRQFSRISSTKLGIFKTAKVWLWNGVADYARYFWRETPISVVKLSSNRNFSRRKRHARSQWIDRSKLASLTNAEKRHFLSERLAGDVLSQKAFIHPSLAIKYRYFPFNEPYPIVRIFFFFSL